jgi:hypothetical protein
VKLIGYTLTCFIPKISERFSDSLETNCDNSCSDTESASDREMSGVTEVNIVVG